MRQLAHPHDTSYSITHRQTKNITQNQQTLLPLAGSDSIAKATEQASLAVLPEASPPPEGDPQTKSEAAPDPADSADRSAASASLSPEQDASQHAQQQQSPQQQTAAAQWVETDDLGVSKRQVATVTKHALPNGVMPQSPGSSQQPQGRNGQLQGGSQLPQGSIQQALAGSQQPQGSMEQLQGASQAPQGSIQEPQGRMQQPEGGMHGAALMAEVKSESDGLPLSSEQAAQSGHSGSLFKHELPDTDQVRYLVHSMCCSLQTKCLLSSQLLVFLPSHVTGCHVRKLVNHEKG